MWPELVGLLDGGRAVFCSRNRRGARLRAAVCLLGALSVAPSKLEAVPNTALPSLTNLPPTVTRQLRVTEFGVAVPLADYRRTCATGTRLPLFQENDQFYVAKLSTVEYGDLLCAFPKVDNLGMGTAWVTKEKLLIFGIPTRSVPGRFFLTKNEILPILEETATDYVVLLERYGERVALPVPKNLHGIVCEDIPPPPPPPPAPPPEEPRRIVLDMAALEQGAPLPAPCAKPSRKVSPPAAHRPAPAPAPPAESPREPEKTVEPPPAPAVGPTQAVAAAEPPAQANAPPPQAPSPAWWARAPAIVTGLQVLLTALLVAYLFLHARARTKVAAAPPEPPPGQEVQTFTTVGESLASDYFHQLASETGDFSGSLEGFSPAELVQFLHSAKETGVLLTKDAQGKVSGEFYFDQGEIIDATHGTHRAEHAVHALLRGHDAAFAFNRVSVAKRNRTIRQNTMGLLLDASKNLDESRNA